MALEKRQPYVSEPPELLGAKRVGDLKHQIIEALAGAPYDPAGTAAAEIVDHEAAGNPHPIYRTLAFFLSR